MTRWSGAGARGRALALSAAVLLAGAAGAEAQAAAGGLSLTVDQAVSRALANQPSLQQAMAAAEAAGSRVGEAQSAYYPIVTAGGTYTRLEPDQSFTFPGLGTFSLAPVDNWDFHVGVTQVITQFGKREAQVRLAKSGEAAARIGVEQAKTGLGYQAAQLFYTALFLREQGAALDSQYANLQQHLQVIQVREETGSATKLEVLSTQVRMATLQSQRADVDSQLRKQMIALRQLTGIDPTAEITLVGSFQPGTEPPDAAALVAAALQKRAEVRQAREAEEAAAMGVAVAFDSAYPTLLARGALGFKNGMLPDISALTFNWNAGISLSVPIFQGFLWARSVDEARQRVDSAKAASQAARLSVTTQVLQAVQDVQGAREQVAISAGALDQAKQMVEVAKVQYDIGVITNLEYLDAQTALETAALTNLAARYREVLAEYALRQATGEPLAD